MLDQPPLVEVENQRPEENKSFTDSFNSKQEYFTPKTGEELREIKQLLMAHSNSQYENGSNPILGASASSKASKELPPTGYLPDPLMSDGPGDSIVYEAVRDALFEPGASKRRIGKNESGVNLTNLNESDIVAPPLANEVGSSFYEDSDSSEDEGLPDYKVGGYHPVHVGETYADRYVIIQKLGWGHFSTVWLAKDLKYQTYVALKVQKSESHYIEAAYDEVEILDQVSSFWKKHEWQDSLKEYYKDDPEKLAEIENCSKY